jgi:lipoprotein-anchoring transpeptidase ErfK/SrfK
MKKRTPTSGWLLWVMIVLPYVILASAAGWYFKTLKAVEQASIIVVNKGDMMLYQYDYQGRILLKERIATGKVPGNKKVKGDYKTPEGIFSVASIEDASTWSHDFKDDTLGVIDGAYGPYFVRLNVPGQKGIGIHGTHDNNSLGTRASEGCIRMKNEALVNLVSNIKKSTVVIVTPGVEDVQREVQDSILKNTPIKTAVKQAVKSKEKATSVKRVI